MFVPQTTSLTEQGFGERLGRAADVFERSRARVFLRAARVGAPAGDGGLTYEWALSEATLGNCDWYLFLETGEG